MTFRSNDTAGKVGQIAAWLLVALQLLYAAVTAIGFATLPAPDVPIQDPWFTLMEVLILLMIPLLVMVAAALHQWVDPGRQVFAVAALALTAALVTVTALVHFSVLTLSRQPAFAGQTDIFGFAWPSVVYAADILAWDFFFPCMALAFSAALSGPGPNRVARWLFALSAVLAFAGLAGVPLANMAVRNIGIVGYALVYPAALAALAVSFRKKEP